MKTSWKHGWIIACFLWVPFIAPNCGFSTEIKIKGTEKFQNTISNALLLLQIKAPLAYQIITNNIEIIDESSHSGMEASIAHPTFDLNDRSAYFSLTWCAGVIAHDSYHSKLYHDYHKSHVGKVPDTIWIGHAAEQKCLNHQLQVLKEIGAPKSEVDYCAATSPDYADVPYTNRNW